MSSLVYEVFSKPEIRDALKADPSKIASAVEEALRLRPPFFGFFRRTTQATDVGGIEIPAGTDVYMGWAAANRGPQAFGAATENRLNRPPNRHLSFGWGIHTCPGAALALIELRGLLEEVLRRIPDLRVALDQPGYSFGGGDYVFMATLPVTVAPGVPGRRVSEHQATGVSATRRS